MVLVRDAFACKPAVVAETDQYVAISSEFRSLAHLPGVAEANIFEPLPEQIYVMEGGGMKPVRLDLSTMSVRELNDYLHHRAGRRRRARSRDPQSQRHAQHRGRTWTIQSRCTYGATPAISSGA